MNRLTSNRPSLLTVSMVFVLTVIGAFTASSAFARVITCPMKNSTDINAAINMAPFGPTVIEVDGVCVGNVVIARDDVTLQGVTPNANKIQGRITVTGDRVVIRDLEVVGNGSGNGILLDNGASAMIDNVTVKGHSNGIQVRLSSTARIDDSEIKDNTTRQLLVTENSSVRLSDSEINSAGSIEAVGVFRLGMLRLRGGNEITNTVGDAISAFHGAQVRQDGGFDTITSADLVIGVGALSEAELRNFETNGNIIGIDKSLVRMRNGTHNGNITLRRDSAATFSTTDGPATVNGNLVCDDDESSHFAPAGTIITGANTCSGY